MNSGKEVTRVLKNSRKEVTYLHTDNKDGNYIFADGFQEGSNISAHG